MIISEAFASPGMTSVTVLLPPGRTKVKGLLRLGFQQDGEAQIENERFVRYRLRKPEKV